MSKPEIDLTFDIKEYFLENAENADRFWKV